MRAEQSSSTETTSFDSEKVLKDLQEKVRKCDLARVAGSVSASVHFSRLVRTARRCDLTSVLYFMTAVGRR